MNREETCLRGISRESEACSREKIARHPLSLLKSFGCQLCHLLSFFTAKL